MAAYPVAIVLEDLSALLVIFPVDLTPGPALVENAKGVVLLVLSGGRADAGPVPARVVICPYIDTLRPDTYGV